MGSVPSWYSRGAGGTERWPGLPKGAQQGGAERVSTL